MVLSLLDWPGYSTDVGSLADPVDGYLVTVHLPPGSNGRVVHVDFHPPGWHLELGAWVLALVAGAGWSVVSAVRRRVDRPSAVNAAQREHGVAALGEREHGGGAVGRVGRTRGPGELLADAAHQGIRVGSSSSRE